jgi:hypothetical protein
MYKLLALCAIITYNKHLQINMCEDEVKCQKSLIQSVETSELSSTVYKEAVIV